MAMRTSSATLRAPIRSITQARWFSTVLGLMLSRAPISLLDNPAEIEPQLRANYRQDEKNPDQDHQPIGLQQRGAMRREPLTGNMGENFGSHKSVHETTTDS
jgi:hypothetical protein